MRLVSFITKTSRISCLLFVSGLAAFSQKVAILTPDMAEQSRDVALRIAASLTDKIRVLDTDMVKAAYDAVAPQTPFNLTRDESKLIAAATGCDFFVLLRSATQRRSAFRRNEYYEAFAHVYIFSSRTGKLIFWKNQKREADSSIRAVQMLDQSVDALSSDMFDAIRREQKSESSPTPIPVVEEVPGDDSAADKDFKAPIPYRRIKPAYTTEAALYDVTATVDILVDTDAGGAITRTEIVRWAGFGLDESVEAAVRAMNWRPAVRNGKALPMRFLLRYNFKKIEREK